MIKQVVPQEVCLECQGCCRFQKIDSVWSPCLLDEEIQDLLDKKIPPAGISSNKKPLLIPNAQGTGFICPFFDAKDNKCKIYGFRPFECQLYPFLINRKEEKFFLAVDLKCPFVQENLESQKVKAYVQYLTNFFNSPRSIKILRDNSRVVQIYAGVLNLAELKL